MDAQRCVPGWKRHEISATRISGCESIHNRPDRWSADTRRVVVTRALQNANKHLKRRRGPRCSDEQPAQIARKPIFDPYEMGRPEGMGSRGQITSGDSRMGHTCCLHVPPDVFNGKLRLCREPAHRMKASIKVVQLHLPNGSGPKIQPKQEIGTIWKKPLLKILGCPKPKLSFSLNVTEG